MALSGGEAQRMHMARALAQAETAATPFWLLLDEPVSSLDLAHQMAVMDMARAFAQAGGGVLMVLHDLNLAVRGADRIIVLHNGAIAADGVPLEVLTDSLIAEVYGCDVPVNRVPEAAPFLLVQSQPGPMSRFQG
jgi:iron complex transport system ATP-binding protein